MLFPFQEEAAAAEKVRGHVVFHCLLCPVLFLCVPQACDDPLNSDDDIDDDLGEDEPGNDFETKDNIVCQWEKVRVRVWVGVVGRR